jgi:hypothetical protein
MSSLCHFKCNVKFKIINKLKFNNNHLKSDKSNDNFKNYITFCNDKIKIKNPHSSTTNGDFMK